MKRFRSFDAYFDAVLRPALPSAVRRMPWVLDEIYGVARKAYFSGRSSMRSRKKASSRRELME